MASQIPNQSNYQDSQNFDIDVDQVYSDFITSIDKVRSYTNSNSITTQSATSIFQKTDTALTKLRELTTVESTVQESRCHAFFRIIGLPIVSKDFKLYNPGLDIVYSANRKITLPTKLNIAANQISKSREISIQRETYVSNVLNIFNKPNSIDAGTLALSSGAKIRPFISPFANSSEPFDTEIKSQQYKIDLSGLVGVNEKKLTEYLDVNGNTPTKLFTQRAHFIKPFLVDPVIDFTINDATRLVAIPFVPTKSELFVRAGDNGFVNRPIIEQIIRERFILTNQAADPGSSNQAIIDYIKNIPSIQDEALINKISGGDVYQLTEQTQFVKFLNIMRAMIDKLVQAQLSIYEAQSKYYWVPVPSISGPEGGCTVQGVFLSEKVPSDFITPRDQAIIEAKIKTTVNQINSLTADIQGVPDVGGFAFDSFKNTFSPDTSAGLGDTSAQSLAELTNKRNFQLQKANDALRTIEIIMGEFSGLGLCDIIAVMGTLYIMPKNDLLGFLDEDAIARMNVSLKLNVSSPGVQVAANSFSSTVKDFYNLMDKIYQDVSQNNGI